MDDVIYMCRNQGFVFRKTVIYKVMYGIVCLTCTSTSCLLPTRQLINTGACKTHYTIHNCIYNRLPEDEPLVSKHVDDIIH
jgi:hypothetical protein